MFFVFYRSDGRTERSFLPEGAADCHYLHRNVSGAAVAAISDCRPGQLRGFVATQGIISATNEVRVFSRN